MNKTMIQLDATIFACYRSAINSYIKQIEKQRPEQEDKLGQYYHYLSMADYVIGHDCYVSLKWYLQGGNFDAETLAAANGELIASRFD